MATDAPRNSVSLSIDTTTIAITRCTVRTRRSGCQVWDILRNRMARTDIGNANVLRLARFAQGIIARIEILSLLVIEKGMC